MVTAIALTLGLGLAFAQEDAPAAEADAPADASPPAAEASAPAPAPAPAAAPARPAPARVFHAPPPRPAAGEPLDVTVEVADISALGQLVLRYRRSGKDEWREVGFDRKGNQWVARIPAKSVQPPSVDYVVVSRDGRGREVPRFATTERPHTILLPGKTRLSEEEVALKHYDGKRSIFTLGGSYQSFGPSTQGATDANRVYGGTYEYRVLRALQTLRFGFSTLRGSTWDITRPAQELEAGFDFAFAEAEFGNADTVGVRVRTVLGAEVDRFTAGGGGQLRIGRDYGTHVDLYYENVIDLGQTMGVGLTWDTVPKVPMTAAVEATSWPRAGDFATRLRYQADLPLASWAFLRAHASYQARLATSGGPGGGLEVACTW